MKEYKISAKIVFCNNFSLAFEDDLSYSFDDKLKVNIQDKDDKNSLNVILKINAEKLYG